MLAAIMLMAGCGGGGGSGGGGGGAATPPAVDPNPTFTPGSYAASSTFSARCAMPRTGTNPATNAPYTERLANVVWENFWLRSWTRELYLWYREVADRDPSLDATALAYFATRMTSATTSSGRARDQFHFTYPTTDWLALSQSGVSAGYGIEWVLLARTPPRAAAVAFTEPNSPAAAANIGRGVRVLNVDGVDLVNDNTQAGVNTINAGMFPSGAGQSHTFVLQELNGSTRTVTLVSASVTSVPVQNVQVINTPSGAVGYMLFNDHIATAELGLFNAFTQMRSANVTDLVLDLRYNGGGLLALASQVAYMIAGSTATTGRTFEQLQFNDQYAANVNPITGGSNGPLPFASAGLGYSVTSGTALPTLNLARVFVLTGSGTCSASESIINSLRGVGLQVLQIGTGTCGKPYGFYPQDNCGTTYFSVQFRGINAQGFGDYADGFAPIFPAGNAGVLLPGCTVADDFSQPLGNASERRLAAALYYRTNGTCSTALTSAPDTGVQAALRIDEEGGLAIEAPSDPWRTNRIIEAPP